MQLFVASPLSTQHKEERSETEYCSLDAKQQLINQSVIFVLHRNIPEGSIVASQGDGS
jgi:hypothetical protein